MRVMLEVTSDGDIVHDGGTYPLFDFDPESLGDDPMEAYRLILNERTRWAKAIALRDPTTETMTAYGQAVMNGWDAQWLGTTGTLLVPAICA